MKRHVLILGGGFAGYTTARRLERSMRASERDDIEITLVARDNYITFTPMLPGVPASTLAPRHVVSPLRASLHQTRFVRAEVHHIDADAKQVTVAEIPSHHGAETRVLSYDDLVVALGSTNNFFGVSGAQEFGLTMKSVGDAMRLRNRILDVIEAADAEDSPRRRRGLMTLAIVGVGFSGCETAGELMEFLQRTLKYYPRISHEDLRVVLLGLDTNLMPEMPAKLGHYAQKILRRQGVEVMLETEITEVAADHILFRQNQGDVQRMETHTVIWTAGVGPLPGVRHLTDDDHKGRIPVDSTLCSPTHPGLWALGDCAAVPNTEGPGFCSLSAQHAIRQAERLVSNLLARHRGEPPRPYTYRPMGLMASLGHHHAVASLFGFPISGFFAWWLWRTYYLSRIPGWDRKLRVALDWTVDLLLPRDTVLLRFEGDRPHK